MAEYFEPIIEPDKYPVLAVVATIFKVFAIIAGIGGIIGALIGLEQISESTRESPGWLIIAAAGIPLIYGALLCSCLLAYSESIKVFLAMEANTRLTNECLKELLRRGTRLPEGP